MVSAEALKPKEVTVYRKRRVRLDHGEIRETGEYGRGSCLQQRCHDKKCTTCWWRDLEIDMHFGLRDCLRKHKDENDLKVYV